MEDGEEENVPERDEDKQQQQQQQQPPRVHKKSKRTNEQNKQYDQHTLLCVGTYILPCENFASQGMRIAEAMFQYKLCPEFFSSISACKKIVRSGEMFNENGEKLSIHSCVYGGMKLLRKTKMLAQSALDLKQRQRREVLERGGSNLSQKYTGKKEGEEKDEEENGHEGKRKVAKGKKVTEAEEEEVAEAEETEEAGGGGGGRREGIVVDKVEVVYEDNFTGVVVKLPGMLTMHERRGPGEWSPSLKLLAANSLSPSPLPWTCPPHPCHRLDKPVGGLVLLGKTKPTIAALGKAFEKREISKRYRAILVGCFPSSSSSSSSSSSVSNRSKSTAELLWVNTPYAGCVCSGVQFSRCRSSLSSDILITSPSLTVTSSPTTETTYSSIAPASLTAAFASATATSTTTVRENVLEEPLFSSVMATTPPAHLHCDCYFKFQIVGSVDSKHATTFGRILRRTACLTEVELCPYTGRQHQLRKHCSAVGFPILGDPFYGGDRTNAYNGDLYLWNTFIGFPTQGTQDSITEVFKPPPIYFDKLFT